MTAVAQPSLERAVVRGRTRSLLAPGGAFAAVWIVVLLIWISVGDRTFARTTGAERYTSTSSVSYMAWRWGCSSLVRESRA